MTTCCLQSIFEYLNRTPQEKDKVHKFKQRCNAFLLEIVSRMCFVGTTPPDKEVVDALMGYVTKQPIGGVSSRKMTKTKRMSIFNDDLDPSPVVRSVLLQLLLKSRSGFRKTHM